MISYYHRRLQTACDENVITTDSLLLRPKNASDGLYEPLVTCLNVVVLVDWPRLTEAGLIVVRLRKWIYRCGYLKTPASNNSRFLEVVVLR